MINKGNLHALAINVAQSLAQPPGFECVSGRLSFGLECPGR